MCKLYWLVKKRLQKSLLYFNKYEKIVQNRLVDFECRHRECQVIITIVIFYIKNKKPKGITMQAAFPVTKEIIYRALDHF